MIRERGNQARTRNVASAALRFFFGKTLRDQALAGLIPRARVNKQLPVILSGSEVQRLLAAFHLPTHLTIAMLCYGAGLRAQEACSLRVADIDGERKVLLIRHRSKRGRHRQIPLSTRLHHQLRSYYAGARPPGIYLSRTHVAASSQTHSTCSAPRTPSPSDEQAVPHAPGAARPRFEIGNIARMHGASVVAAGGLRLEQRRVLSAIRLCRTAVLGGHLDVCGDCGHERPSYNSCRNRHCPKCQAIAQHRWLEARRRRLLPVHHFHVVFTIPSELRSLFRRNRRLLCGLLMRAAATTLQTVAGEERFLGAQIGVTAVLHTWSRDLSWHPHVHCVVTGGGLRADGSWRSTRPGFLFPVRVLGRTFRGKLLASLKRLRDSGYLRDESEGSDPQAWPKLLSRLYAKDWVVYCKKPFGGVDSVYAYLGRYTHRIGLSNRRILDVSEDAVTFATRHGKRASFPPGTFLRRFLEHVLPKGFVRIRHYGLLASGNVHGRLARARAALQPSSVPRAVEEPGAVGADTSTPEDELARLVLGFTGIDLQRCPRCRGPSMWLRHAPLPRGPPS